MRNVTVSLDDATYARTRVRAAERKMSLSRYIGEALREHTGHTREYEAAMRAALAEKPLDLKGPWKPYPKRDELYDRPVLRRR
ncbi:MAG TPA: CopG family transcriptional regulator [Burkholderiales bacterium]|nr:CopG family transcriptional regulator [Burkholderiales bacterium]